MELGKASNCFSMKLNKAGKVLDLSGLHFLLSQFKKSYWTAPRFNSRVPWFYQFRKQQVIFPVGSDTVCLSAKMCYSRFK